MRFHASMRPAVVAALLIDVVSLLVISLVNELQKLCDQSGWYNLVLGKSGQYSAQQCFVALLTNGSGFTWSALAVCKQCMFLLACASVAWVRICMLADCSCMAVYAR